MSILTHLFGRKTPTANDIGREIERASADLAKAQERLSSAAASLTDIAILSDAEHAAADMAQAEAERNVTRLEARIVALQEAHTEMLKREATAALQARVKATKHSVDVDVPALLDEYDRIAAELAIVLGKLKGIREEVERVNGELRKNPVAEPVPSIDTTYRKEADRVTPERREIRTVWVREVWSGYTKKDAVRVTEEAGIFVFDERGEKVPRDAGYRPERREVVVSHEIRRPGMWLPSFEDIQLPPGRIGRKRHWPKLRET